MLSLAPDVYISDYLQATSKFVGQVKENALRYMLLGYQNELNYRRSDGSFSAFGNQDSEGSSFLTAYVLRVFGRMSSFITVDDQIIGKAESWLLATQSSADGSFSPRGTLIHTDMSGGLDGNAKSAAFTAYVLIALLEPSTDLPATRQLSAVKSALGYLEGQQTALSATSYTLALSTYALWLGGSSKTSTFAALLVAQRQTDADGAIFWRDLLVQTQESKPEPFCYWCAARTYVVETAAYALLYFTGIGDKATGSSVSRWMLTQRNSFGGFYASQDTVVGLQALAAYARVTFASYLPSMSLSISATADGVSTPVTVSISIDQTNSLILQTAEGFGAVLGKPNARVEVKATGTGVAVVQAILTFNTDEKYLPPLPPLFDLTVDYSSRPGGKDYDVDSCLTYKGNSTSTDMVVMEVGLPTGFVSDQDSLALLVGTKGIKRTELSSDGSSVAVYFDDAVIGQKKCVTFMVTDTLGVKALQPPVSQVYRYYSPQEQGSFQRLVLSNSSTASASLCLLRSLLILAPILMTLF